MAKTQRQIAKEKVIKTYWEIEQKILPEEIAKWGAIDTQILHRFCLEPRTNRDGRSKWLVVYDKYAQDYVRTPDKPREYMCFNNTDEAIKYFRKAYIKENKKEE